MKRLLLLLPQLIIAFVLTGCNNNEDNTPEEAAYKYAGEPYTGSMEVELKIPEAEVENFYGDGSVYFEDVNDSSRLVVFGTFGEEGEVSFSIMGLQNGQRWHGESEGVSFSIDEVGKISGGGTIYPYELSFGGTASDADFDLQFSFEILEEIEEDGLPVGTQIVYQYDLSRIVPGEDNNGNSQCNNIVWRTRTIWTPGNNLQMIQVPVCVD